MLKLYVWENVLCDWQCGIAFAFATTPEEAKQMLVNKGILGHWDGLLLDDQAHTEYTTPTAFWMFGSS